ncbi:PEP-CTERM sorting domain-containing protein [Coraliomargarita algicola]|uniref:PEP-CTERM sorting domain-containing protein n=1 Tax=Coraliomargarita algicola TaxID=3092156 RepID=A0ABZ0RKA0_9BACT|nr:PEP-CTERM sorting domain-containing protein [Coraliomargarita sp. J2-16]WPJ95694.1 PEP-CTERM sorting domain-containing protein [Coraliomargarita sp. J2-16]
MNTLNTQIRLLSAVAAVSLFAASFAQAEEVLLNDSFTTSAVVEEALQFNDLDSNDWRATSGTNWAIASGNLTNSGGGTNAQDEGGLGKLIDLTGISDTSLNQLKLDVTFTTAEAGEELYVHIRGFIGSAPADTTDFINRNATAGNLWDLTGTAFTATTNKINLNSGIGFDAFDNTTATSAVELSDGDAGLHNFSQTFDMSGYAVNTIVGYDYLVLAFTRDELGTSPSVSIADITLTAIPEPGTYALLAGLTGLVFVMVRRRR